MSSVPHTTPDTIDIAPSDEVRITRLAAKFLGAAFILYFLFLIPLITAQAASYPAWWTPIAVVAAFGPGVALLGFAFRSSLQRIRLTAIACAAGYVIAAVGTIALCPDELLTDAAWLRMFPGLAAMCIALTRRVTLCVISLVVITALSQAVNAQSVPGQESIPILDGIEAFTFSLMFVAAILMTLRAGKVLDETRPEVYQAAAAAASAHAREVERERFTDLIHDWVMASLGSVVRRVPSESVALQARTALEKLDAVDDDTDLDVGVYALAAQVRSAVRDVAPTVVVTSVNSDNDGSLTVPMTAVRVLARSAAEAVRNSVKHAGADALVDVTVSLRSDEVEIAVADTGVGFEPSSVRPVSFGLRRMREQIDGVPGADVVVASTPGDGTTVRLSWSAR